MRGSGPRTGGFTLVASLVAAVTSAGLVAGAEPPGRVRVVDCPGEIAAQLAAGAKLEIDVLLREQASPPPPPEAVVIRCVEASAQIAVTMAGARREATVELGGLAVEHRARAVGLAAAELVQASINAPAVASSSPASPAGASVPPAPAPAPAGVPAPTVTATAASTGSTPASAALRTSLGVGGLAQWLGRPAALLLGARVAFRYPLGGALLAVTSVDGAMGTASTPNAEVEARTATAGLHLYAGRTVGPLRLEAGPGARVGWVHLSGHPVAAAPTLDGAALSAVWGGPEVRARVAYRPTDRGALAIGLELGAGLVVRPVHGLRDGTDPVFAIEGTWLSLALDLSLGLGRDR